MDFTNVVKATIYLADMGDFTIVNEEYGGYFNDDDAPAKELFKSHVAKCSHRNICDCDPLAFGLMIGKPFDRFFQNPTKFQATKMSCDSSSVFK